MERGATGLLRPCAAGRMVVYKIGSRRGYRPGCSRHDREAADQRSRVKRKLKVLDFVQSGGPILTIDRTVFKMWLGVF